MIGGDTSGNIEDFPYMYGIILGDPPGFASELKSQKSLE